MTPIHTRRLSHLLVWAVAMILFALAVSPSSGCVGAPRNVEELDAMPEAEFEDWKLRTAAVAEEAAYAVVSDSPESLGKVEGLSTALRVMCAGPISADLVRDLGMREEYAGLMRIATLELAAVIRQRIGPSSHPRLQALVCAFADALETGALRALDAKH